MLVVDAWFDIVTDSTTRDVMISVVNAAVGELTLAALAFLVAFRLIRLATHDHKVGPDTLPFCPGRLT